MAKRLPIGVYDRVNRSRLTTRNGGHWIMVVAGPLVWATRERQRQRRMSKIPQAL
ncbi:hypothetical protein ACIBO5_51190 [Nonomuraea angiospora]|uniref:hypothetical protein n=1 Tax=Nonomuraea angiospora TaxID=46172 RepID=UPI0029A7E007|nr:hypothetical protein [Nonomuraea angiospora]MDX3111170.1 hypothetical protein [Nonomuraea angiospora]